MKKVLVLGGVSYDSIIYLDHLPQPQPATLYSKGYHESVGSTGAGKALNLNRLGFDVTLHAMIGADEAGERVRRYFEYEKLKFLYDVDPRGTERHTNLLDQDGRRISIYTHHATFEPQFDQGRLETLIKEADVIILNILNYCRHLIPAIRACGKAIWCDIHDYDGKNPYHQDFIDAADYLFVSSDALPDYRAFMRRMIDAGKMLVVCTHGKQGATAFSADGKWHEVEAIPYPFKDSNGAGDSFFAGFLYGHEQGYEVEKCLKLAAISGGLCVTSTELFYPELSVSKLETEYRRINT